MGPYLVIQRSVCQAPMIRHRLPIHSAGESDTIGLMADDTIGARIASARKAKGLTQEQLARALDASGQTVSRWERNAFAPDETYLPKLATVLDVTPAWIEYGLAKPEPVLDRSTSQLPADPLLEQFLVDADCTPEEAEALRSANWKLVAGANYGVDFLQRVLLMRRKPAPAVQTALPAGVQRVPAAKKKRT